jgi:hypothetical protein
VVFRRIISFVLFAAFLLSACQVATPTPALRSGNGTQKVRLIFTNNTPSVIKLKWVDINGVEEQSEIVMLGSSSALIDTYNTYVWRVYDLGGILIGEVVASGEETQVYEIKKDKTLFQTAPAPVVSLGERSYMDRPDDFVNRYQIHVIYALFKDDNDKRRDLDGSIANSIKLANKWLKEQTGGSTLRFDLYQGELDITFMQFDTSGEDVLENYRMQFNTHQRRDPEVMIEDYYLNYFYEVLNGLDYYETGKLYVQRGKYYIVYIEKEHPSGCGVSMDSVFPGLIYLGTQNCGYDASKLGTAAGFLLMHETLHGIGFVPLCAPHNADNTGGHVGDSQVDLMASSASMLGVQPFILDVGNDDYFNANIPGCPDLSKSVFFEPLPEDAQVPANWPGKWRLR